MLLFLTVLKLELINIQANPSENAKNKIKKNQKLSTTGS